MQDRKDIEAWADAMLDQHRSAPPPAHRSPEDLERLVDDLPPLWRFMVRQSDQPLEPDKVERLHRSLNRTRYFAQLEGIATLVLFAVLGAFAIAFYSGF